ncbi:MAG TPA: DNA polymerase III subunit delta [Candidatus Limnocylindrales bacterium]
MPLVAGLLVLGVAVAEPAVPARWRGPGTALGLGALLLGLRVLVGPGAAATPPVPDGSGPWTAVVESVGSPKDGAQLARLRLRSESGEVTVAATLPAFPSVAAGDLVDVGGRLRPPPDDDPYGDYLRRSGAAGSLDARTLTVRDAAPVGLQSLRDASGDALQRSLPEPEAGLAAGILVGLRERVDRSLAADFATAGVSHVVAISGWNIAIVAGLVGALMRGRPRRLVTVAILATVVAYVVAAGASPSVVRAAVMAGVVLLARETGRAGRAPTALGLGAALLVLAEPTMIGDAGFRLSVMATAGLLAWANPLAARLRRLGGGRMPGWLAESLGISLAAQAATLPDVLATFGRLSLVSPIVNLAVVPLVPAAMLGGVVAMLAGSATMLGAPAVIGTVMGLPGWVLLHVIVVFVRLAASVPFAALTLPPGVAEAAAIVAGVGVLAVPLTWGRMQERFGGRSRRTRKVPVPAATRPHRKRSGPTIGRPERVAVAVAGLAVAVAGAALSDATGRATRITVMDVGQGDAILLETRTGARMLIDGGPDPDRVLLALDERIPPWDRRLDVVVLTHPHEDHVAGLARVLSRYSVGKVYEPGMRGPGPGWAAWNAELRDGPPRAGLQTGAQLRLGEVHLSVLWPDPGSVPLKPTDTGTGINNVSIVFLGEANGRRFLLMGDVEQGIDPTLLARGLPRVDLLKVAHHGSATASTQPFLDAVRPRVAIASAGAGNPYGHPAKSTLDRIRATGADVYRTDQDGSVEVELREDGLTVHETGARAAAQTIPAIAVTSAGANPIAAPLAFLCAIPVEPGSPAWVASSTGSAPVAVQPPWPAPGSIDHVSAWADPTGYDPMHDDPRSPRSRPPAGVAASVGQVHAPRLRRRRRGGVPGAPSEPGRPSGGPATGRDGRPAPRRRQARLGADARPPPARRGVRGVARGPRVRGARAGGPGPPGDPVGGARVRGLGHDGAARGAHRRLRRQASGPAPGADGGAVRALASQVPARFGEGRAPQRWRRVERGDVRAGRAPRRGPGTGGLRGRRRRSQGRRPAPVVPARPPRDQGVSADVPVIAYFRGDDGFTMDAAVAALGRRLEQESGAAPDRWRTPGAETNAADIAMRVATAPLFGGGTVAVVVDPAPLLRSKAEREALEGAIRTVAPGNALVFLEQGDGGSRRSAALQGLEASVQRAGGDAKEFRAPREGQLAAWIEGRANERSIAMAPGAAKELARRVGGFVREGDVDRQRQGALAVAELEKLSLYRPFDPVTEADVRALVAEVVPDSTWAFLDAVADRKVAVAAPLLDRLLESTPEPVLLVQLHRRIRELIEVADHLAAGATPGSLVRTLGMKPFRVDKLVGQARRWRVAELEDALEGLLELDAMVKGAPDAGATEAQRRLAFSLWMRERVAPAA